MTAIAPWAYPLLAAGPATALLALRPAARRAGLPLADAPALGRAARRTAAVRAVLAVALVGLVAGAAALVERPRAPIAGLLSADSSTVVVLDASASVSDLVFREIARTLEEVVAAAGDERRVGLVMFSDVAQEALPPGTRAAELRPFIRFFKPRNEPGATARPTLYRAAGPGAPSPIQYLLSPWYRKFSGGTRISTGLAAAREALARDGVDGARVLLVSDLEEAEGDLPSLAAELGTYARRGIDLGVVALPPAVDADLDFYRRVLGDPGAVVASPSVTAGSGSAGAVGAFPTWFAVVAVLVALALAANELAAVPLTWRREPAR